MATVNGGPHIQVYRTPPALLDAVQERFGKITFDAACTEQDAVAPVGYYWPEFDALQRDWSAEIMGETVWCNPMWRDAGKYAAKCAGFARDGGRVLLNVQLAPDSNWYEQHVHGQALVLALNPRVPYLNPDGTPAFKDKNGKALGINRPVMVAAYGFGPPGFEPWRWQQKRPQYIHQP